MSGSAGERAPATSRGRYAAQPGPACSRRSPGTAAPPASRTAYGAVVMRDPAPGSPLRSSYTYRDRGTTHRPHRDHPAACVLAGNGSQSWPQVALSTPADATHVGDPITVADEQNCAPGPDVGSPGVSSTGRCLRLVDAGVSRRRRPSRHRSRRSGHANRDRVPERAERRRPGTCSSAICTVSRDTTRVATTPPSRHGNIRRPARSRPAASPSTRSRHRRSPVTPGSATSSGRRARASRRTRVYLTAVPPRRYTSWSTPLAGRVAAGSRASQLMPSVTAQGTRADIVYLDTRPVNEVRHLPDFADVGAGGAAIRGRDISLTGGRSRTLPTPARRSASASDAADYEAPDAQAASWPRYFPDGNGGFSALRCPRPTLAHGTTTPTLPAGAAPSTSARTRPSTRRAG